MAYSTRWSEALTSDLDRMASRNGLVAVLCGAAAGFAAGGLLGAWLATRRQRASTPQPRPLARIAVNDGAFEPPSAPPSNLGSLPVTPRGTDGGYDEDAEVKMVLVVRSDLKMGKGKVAAQCCHATLGQFKKLWKRKDPNLRRWEMSGQTKVCLRVDDEEGLLQLQQAARNADVPVHIVVDAGRTQIAPDSKTVIALGPADSGLIDSVTGHLKLL